MITDRMSSGLGEGAKRYGSNIENAAIGESREFQCEKCGYKFVMRLKTNEISHCPHCGTSDISILNDIENNLCAICAKQIEGWKKYAEHMKETHNCVLNSDGSVSRL